MKIKSKIPSLAAHFSVGMREVNEKNGILNAKHAKLYVNFLAMQNFNDVDLFMNKEYHFPLPPTCLPPTHTRAPGCVLSNIVFLRINK
jgi:hypothetical protein